MKYPNIIPDRDHDIGYLMMFPKRSLFISNMLKTDESLSDDYLIDMAKLHEVIGPKTKAFIPDPIPLHQQKCFRDLDSSGGKFPIAKKLAEEILSLPMYPHIREEQQEYVVEKVN